jgi:nucleotide-binding universal stress UspA family protein
MTTSEPRGSAPSARLTTGEVVAGLVNDGSAQAVAEAAVAEAVRLGCDVRFVQAITSRLGADDSATADEATFHAALRALRGHSRVRCTFEAVRGDPGTVLVARSRQAAMLVVGEDRPTAKSRVAEYCQSLAACTVKLIPTQVSGTQVPTKD